jgi:serine/threonine protein kinase
MTPDPVKQDARFGKYQIQDRLGIGGVGTVYKALDVELDRVVALKLLAARWASRPEVVARFRSEARTAAKLRHENIVGVYEFGEIAGVHYLAMEYIDGPDLHEMVQNKRRLEPAEARQFLLQATLALDHAHQQGLVHRDVKPPNFLVTQHEGKPLLKLTDFGLARMVEDRDYSVTGDGLTVGTADYIAPEQARNSRLADIRSDLYSLGCTFFYMLAGRAPFAKGSAAERLLAHLHTEPPNVRQFNPDVPIELVNILRRLLAKNPRDRFQTPKELLQELSRLEKTRTIGPGRRITAQPTVVDDASANETTALSIRPPARTRRLPPGQRGALEAEFDRASELSARGDHRQALRILHQCCRSDPGNLAFRQALRRVAKVQYSLGRPGFLRTWLATLLRKVKLQKSRRTGDFAQVLALGEEVLERNPADIGVVLAMAEAADALELRDVAGWLLAAALHEHPHHPRLSRALAFLNERRGNFAQAIALWKMISSRSPDDAEARQKLKDLAAKQAISLGDYRARFEEAE